MNPKDLLLELRTALNESSNFWQAVAAHYGVDNPLKDAEMESLRIRDAAIAQIDAALQNYEVVENERKRIMPQLEKEELEVRLADGAEITMAAMASLFIKVQGGIEAAASLTFGNQPDGPCALVMTFAGSKARKMRSLVLEHFPGSHFNEHRLVQTPNGIEIIPE